MVLNHPLNKKVIRKSRRGLSPFFYAHFRTFNFRYSSANMAQFNFLWSI